MHTSVGLPRPRIPALPRFTPPLMRKCSASISIGGARRHLLSVACARRARLSVVVAVFRVRSVPIRALQVSKATLPQRRATTVAPTRLPPSPAPKFLSPRALCNARRPTRPSRTAASRPSKSKSKSHARRSRKRCACARALASARRRWWVRAGRDGPRPRLPRRRAAGGRSCLWCTGWSLWGICSVCASGSSSSVGSACARRAASRRAALRTSSRPSRRTSCRARSREARRWRRREQSHTRSGSSCKAAAASRAATARRMRCSDTASQSAVSSC